MPVPREELLLEPVSESDALLADEVALSDADDVAELAAWTLAMLRQVNKARMAVREVGFIMLVRSGSIECPDVTASPACEQA